VPLPAPLSAHHAADLVIYVADMGEGWYKADAHPINASGTGFRDGFESDIVGVAGRQQGSEVFARAWTFNSSSDAEAFYQTEISDTENYSRSPCSTGDQCTEWMITTGAAGRAFEKGNVVWRTGDDGWQTYDRQLMDSISLKELGKF
jgi:hypothetical protein